MVNRRGASHPPVCTNVQHCWFTISRAWARAVWPAGFVVTSQFSCLSVCARLSTLLSVCVCASVHATVCVCVCVRLSTLLSVCVRLSTLLSVCVCVCVCASVHATVCVCVCVCVCPRYGQSVGTRLPVFSSCMLYSLQLRLHTLKRQVSVLVGLLSRRDHRSKAK